MKLFHYDKGDTLLEKFVETIVPIGVVAGVLFMIVAGWGVGHTDYARACARASVWWHLLGTFLAFYALYFGWRAATDRSTLNMSDAARLAIIFVMLGFAWCANFGFDWYFKI